VVTVALVAALREMGIRVAPMKPIEAGSTADAEWLAAAAGHAYPVHMVGPLSLNEPAAPLVAARRAGHTIELEQLDATFNTLRDDSDMIVVEGAGGILVPITESENFATLFRRWSLDVILVAPNRLGVVNHALLTIGAARAHGLTVRAVVLNTTPDGETTLAHETNAELIAKLGNIRVVRFPYVSDPSDLMHLAMLGHTLVSELGV
jgi:dethiobiotin synthetase